MSDAETKPSDSRRTFVLIAVAICLIGGGLYWWMRSDNVQVSTPAIPEPATVIESSAPSLAKQFGEMLKAKTMKGVVSK